MEDMSSLQYLYSFILYQNCSHYSPCRLCNRYSTFTIIVIQIPEVKIGSFTAAFAFENCERFLNLLLVLLTSSLQHCFRIPSLVASGCPTIVSESPA